MPVCRCFPKDFLVACFGLLLHLLDVGLDVWAAVNFYQEGAYASLAVLLLLLVGSSVLVQVFSWFWYSYDDFKMQTKVEKWLSGRLKLLKLLHVLQMGIYVRYAGLLETSWRRLCSPQSDPESVPESVPEGVAVYLRHDLSMLSIIETFSESAPQVVLMLSVILQEVDWQESPQERWQKILQEGLWKFLQDHQLEYVSGLKAGVSMMAVVFSVTILHRNMCYFLPDGAVQRQGLSSSVSYILADRAQLQWLWSLLLYFVCNALLLPSRLYALALVAWVLPYFIFIHFVCSWLVFFLCAWRSGTDFMESPGGEWTYRGMVALIWYFHWFSATKVSRTLLYHGWILLDICILCGVWCWKMGFTTNAGITAAAEVAMYVLGLLVYYMYLHPKVEREQPRGGSREEPRGGSTEPSLPSQPPACNRRMKKLAENFYS